MIWVKSKVIYIQTINAKALPQRREDAEKTYPNVLLIRKR